MVNSIIDIPTHFILVLILFRTLTHSYITKEDRNHKVRHKHSRQTKNWFSLSKQTDEAVKHGAILGEGGECALSVFGSCHLQPARTLFASLTTHSLEIH